MMRTQELAMRNTTFEFLALGIALAAIPSAQPHALESATSPAGPASTWHRLPQHGLALALDSGSCDGVGESEFVVLEHELRVPNFAWMRLYIAECELGES